MDGKICSKCGEFKSYSEFNKRKASKDGYRNDCKECRKLHYQENREKELKRAKEYRDNHKEKIREYNKQYKQNNKEKINEYNRITYNNNNEIKKKHKKRYQRYRDKNKDKINEKLRIKYQENREKELIKAKEYRDSHKEQIRENQKKCLQKSKDNNLQSISNILHQIKPILKELSAYGIIYKIENIKTGRVYIGQTKNPLKIRYTNNVIEDWINERLGKSSQKFKDEILNIDDFKLTEILDVGICKYHLDKLESYYINFYDSYNNGYNNNNGNHKTDDGIEEFKEILQYYNINESELIGG